MASDPGTSSPDVAVALEAYRHVFDLKGRTALVTGASRGIGWAIASALAAYGCRLAVHYSSSRSAADDLVAAVRKSGGEAESFAADLGMAGAGQLLAHAATSAMGKVDILVTSASIEIEQDFADVSAAEFDRQINVNFRATVELMQSLLPAMAERRWGRVLTIGSVQEASPSPRKAIYAATKCAQASLVASMARAYASFGVTLNNLAPGLVATDRTAALKADAAVWKQKLATIPLNRAGTPDDMVGAALLLCSDAGSYITGQDLFADGGLSFPGGRR